MPRKSPNRFREGVDAWFKGVGRENCPYPAGSLERDEWEAGWDSAEEYHKPEAKRG